MPSRLAQWFNRIPILKGGPGSGNWGHTGSPGRGGSPGMGSISNEGSGYEGNVFFSDDIGTAQGRALHGGDIAIDRSFYTEASPTGRAYLVAHEMAHQTVDPFVLNNNDEWNRAEEALTVSIVPRGPYEGRRLFVGGNTRIGEAVSDAIAAHLSDARFGNISDERWRKVNDWATGVIQRAGYSPQALQDSVNQAVGQLDAQL